MDKYESKVIQDGLRAFAKHVPALTRYGEDIEVLDFRKPGTFFYGFRAVFDRGCANNVYISGDIGEAVVYPTCEASLGGMAECFTSRGRDGGVRVNCGYFLEKVCASSDRYVWSREDFLEDFKEKCRGLDEERKGREWIKNHLDAFYPGVEVDTLRGVTLDDDAKSDLREINYEYHYWVYECGRRVSVRVILWLLAMRLAWEALEAKEGGAK